MSIIGGALWLLPHRWPIVFIAPAFYVGGYTWVQVIAFTVLAAVLAEVAFAIVRAMLLSRM